MSKGELEHILHWFSLLFNLKQLKNIAAGLDCCSISVEINNAVLKNREKASGIHSVVTGIQEHRCSEVYKASRKSQC